MQVDWQRMTEKRAKEPMSLGQLQAQDEGINGRKRQIPGMPKLGFMNGTKWGLVPGDEVLDDAYAG